MRITLIQCDGCGHEWRRPFKRPVILSVRVQQENGMRYVEKQACSSACASKVAVAAFDDMIKEATAAVDGA